MARGLKFRTYVVKGLYYPYSENKGAVQLRGYREADLRLCFRICKKPVFSRRGSTYPDFYNGPGHVLSMKYVRELLNIYPNVDFLHLEDVVIGLGLKRLGLRL